MLETLQECSRMADKGDGCHNLYLDYSKAFYTVLHESQQKSWRYWIFFESFCNGLVFICIVDIKGWSLNVYVPVGVM